MEGLLRVDTSTTTLPSSPSNSCFVDADAASICPLLTPSPPTNALVNPLPVPEVAKFTIGDELTTKLQQVKDDKEGEGDSASSSSSSALAEPGCLLNHRQHYHHITKDEEAAAQETIGKTQPMQMTFRNPPENYFFMSWNWPLIRKLALWIFLSALFAMLALVIAMVVSLPKRCNPDTEWYQGHLLYEIFPASFADSNGDGIGDLRGLSTKTDYIASLGVKAVRLNSIFTAHEYPENYKNATSLIEIAKPLGTFKDFLSFVTILHSKNISVVLDLPLHPFVKELRKLNHQLPPDTLVIGETDTISGDQNTNDVLEQGEDVVADALHFWKGHGVDGFYLKGLENYVNDSDFPHALRRWRKVLGPERILIISHHVLKTSPKLYENIILNNVNLVDVRLDMEIGVDQISKLINDVLNSTLFTRRGMPWVHWTLGDVDTVRLANRLNHGNATLGATLLQLMLPGTPSIFYGDEIGLRQIVDQHNDRKDLAHLHQLATMSWNSTQKQFTHKSFIPWMHGEPTVTNFNQLDLVSRMVKFRAESPSIYMNAVYKDDENKANAEVKYSSDDLMVLQRWYPRRKNYVVVSNLGDRQIVKDLSRLLYSGQVVVGPRAESKSETISFKEVSLWPGESVVILLD